MVLSLNADFFKCKIKCMKNSAHSSFASFGEMLATVERDIGHNNMTLGSNLGS